ncbi:hypothetical protein OE88DRAFT_1652618 [Heliocybe sulcata]|uniref:Manganese/iron superoxide dismutase C-terminal domain-containing protein n=1 Tax=Heliocybe sulcata TaxID=5364 RepID=A0A5C3NDR5_9AGAM|nr:hypothetical protein OE88DRAFT_1652618 [Heliocybe sulcata]
MNTSLRAASSSLRATCKRRILKVLVRHVHSRKALPYGTEEGLGNFLTQSALKTLAVDYQQGLLDRLNEEVRDTAHENKSVVQTIIETSWDRTQVLAFNYASEALNNSFFLESLTPPSTGDADETGIHPDLARRIKLQLGSLTQLKSIVSAHALGMFSSGWIWFVTDQSGALGVISTFGTGTLLVRSRQQMGGDDDVAVLNATVSRASSERADSRSHDPSVPPEGPSSATSPVSGVSSHSSPLHPPTQTRTLHTSSRSLQTPRPASIFSSGGDIDDALDYRTSYRTPQDLDEHLGETLYPLFCVSVHERAWMSSGYGVWGKEEYMKRFWTVLNWKKVSQRYQSASSKEQEGFIKS